MQLFAAVATSAHPSVADKLRGIPLEFWWKIGLGIVGIVVAVILLRKVAKANKVMLAVGVFLVSTTVGFNWIYERNEPKWASPAVNWLSSYFPSKGKVESKGHG